MFGCSTYSLRVGCSGLACSSAAWDGFPVNESTGISESQLVGPAPFLG